MASLASVSPVPEASQPESWGACHEEVKEALPLLVPGRESRSEVEGGGPLLCHWLKPGIASRAVLGSALILASIVIFSFAGGRSSLSVKLSKHTQFLESQDECSQYDHLDFLDLVHNNLANQGPQKGAEGMVYLARDVRSGTRAYVHINAMSEYTPFSATMNGWEGPYGCINVQAGSSVDLRVRLTKDAAGKEPLHLKRLALTFVDLDGDVGKTSMESVTASGFEHSLTEDTALLKKTELHDGRTTFEAVARGIGADNPKDPYTLSQMQKDRSVIFFYKNVQEFNLTIGATGGKEPRFMTFIASPLLLCAKTKDIGSQSRPMHSASSILPNLDLHQTQVAIKGNGPDHTFKKWFVESGDDIDEGSWIALIRDPASGRMDILTSSVRGIVADIQPLARGDVIHDRVENDVMAVLQKTEKLPPLQYNPNFETPIRTDVPGYIFGRWIVEVGDVVKKGDKLATAYTPESKEEDIIARCDGKIKALQPLPPSEAIDLLVHDQMVGIMIRQEAIVTTTATATTTTSVTPTSTTRTTSTSTSTATSSTSTSTQTTTTTAEHGLWR